MKSTFSVAVMAVALVGVCRHASAGDVSVLEFGAKGDGVTKDTAAFGKAIAAAAESGGGAVLVPPGQYLVGAIHLRSNVELRLDARARVVFTDSASDYLPAVRTSWEGVECFNYSPLIYALDMTNVAITGGGILEAMTSRWKAWCFRTPAQEAAKLKLVREWGPNDVPIERRDLTALEGANMRPQFIHFNGCRNVRLEGFRIIESPFWCIHFLNCEDVVLRGLDVEAHLSNTDGANFESTRNVLVEDCRFCQGDDVICCKSGLDRDGRRRGRPTENVLVRRCVARRGGGLFTIGSECSGGIRNVALEDCWVLDTCSAALSIKTRPTRGGFIENVRVSRVKALNLTYALVAIMMDNPMWRRYQKGLELCPTRIDGVIVEDVHAQWAPEKVHLVRDDRVPFENIDYRGLSIGDGNAANASGVVSFKDAAKIKSWDAWNDHKGPQAWKEKPCVTWKKLNMSEPGLKRVGTLKTRTAKEIRSSR